IEAVDDWGYAARAALDGMADAERPAWIGVLAYAREASAARPSGRWLKAAAPLVARVGEEAFADRLGQWLDLLGSGPTVALAAPEQPYGFLRSAVPTE